jgi:hypothetical protein
MVPKYASEYLLPKINFFLPLIPSYPSHWSEVEW